MSKRDRRLPISRGAQVTIDFEGQPVSAYEGEPLAVALFASGVQVLGRSIKFHRPRGFFCLSGDCAACLMRIDGIPNLRACRTEVREGLRCERQNAWPSAGIDVLAAADLFFPRGMDHHSMMTSPRILNQLMQSVVRKLGGLGRLPDEGAGVLAERPACAVRHVGVAIIGGGPAGLAAAATVAEACPGHEVLVIEAGAQPGGSYLSHPAYGPQAAEAAARRAQRAGVTILSRAQAVGFYPEDEARPGERGLLAVVGPAGLLKLTAGRYLYATGSHDQNALFFGNDLPGVISARACGLLLCTHGVLPGRRPLVVGDGPYAAALSAALTDAGAKVTRIDGVRERIKGALGRAWVRGASIVDARGNSREVSCDLLAVAVLPAPASELLQQHGARVDFSRRGGFGAVVDEHGRTHVPGVYACGDVTGVQGVSAAREEGARVGQALAREIREAS